MLAVITSELTRLPERAHTQRSHVRPHFFDLILALGKRSDFADRFPSFWDVPIGRHDRTLLFVVDDYQVASIGVLPGILSDRGGGLLSLPARTTDLDSVDAEPLASCDRFTTSIP